MSDSKADCLASKLSLPELLSIPDLGVRSSEAHSTLELVLKTLYPHLDRDNGDGTIQKASFKMLLSAADADRVFYNKVHIGALEHANRLRANRKHGQANSQLNTFQFETSALALTQAIRCLLPKLAENHTDLAYEIEYRGTEKPAATAMETISASAANFSTQDSQKNFSETTDDEEYEDGECEDEEDDDEVPDDKEEDEEADDGVEDEDSQQNPWELLNAYKISILTGVLGIALWWSWPAGNEIAPSNTGKSSESSVTGDLSAELSAQQAKQAGQLKHLRLAQEAADRGAMEEVISRSEVLNGQLEELASVQADWNALAESIVDSETGRRIAARRESLITVASLLDKKRIDDDFTNRLCKRIESTVAPLKQAISVQSYFQPPSDALLFLEEQSIEVPKLIHRYGEDLQIVKGLASSNASGNATFSEALAVLQHERQIDRSQTIAAAVEKERLAGNSQVAAAEAAAEKAERMREKQRIDSEARQKAEAARQALLEQKAKRPDVQRLLAPFITPGYWIPYQKREASVLQPMSWNMIRARCLADKEIGQSQMLYLACFPDKSRPREAWVKGRMFELRRISGTEVFNFRLSPQAIAEIEERQELLRELGPTLVRLKMLLD